MWFPVHFRFLAHSLTTFGRWGCGEQINLSHVVGNFIVVLLEMSRLVAPETRSQTLRRTKRVLNARQGMEGAKTLTEALRRSGAPKPRASGLRSSPELRDSAPRPPARPNRTGLVATRLVGGRRPSVLQRWGSGVLPDGFRLRSRRCRNRAVGGVKGGVAAPCKARCAKSSVARCSHNG